MQALIVIDAQNEFSANGQRPVDNHTSALDAITRDVEAWRRARLPIAWVQHHNRPDETPAFIPGSWGAALSSDFGPREGFGPEALFHKDVYGAFSGTRLDAWLRETGVTRVVLVGFYTHMCVSTSAREALMRGFDVEIDYDATGACALSDPRLGRQSADEVRRTALLQLAHLGAGVRRAGSVYAGAHGGEQLVDHGVV